ncbi:MAG: tannase/feruloyl esterase family alpha/beta hydrolase [Acidobacteria bacterium]|nr:tannase/feruloyl esterase family alpha/beta hydrolase [Acidobacteriota bacterium]
MPTRLAVACCLLVPVLAAQSSPQTQCSSLRALTGYEFSVVTAVLHPAAGNVPEFCRVVGQVQPEVRFEVSLPTFWNKRLLVAGNGGYAGEDLEAPGRIAGRNEALRKEFTFAQTNTGHDAGQEPLGTFAVSSQKLLDYAFRAVHVTAETAKKLAVAYYGSGPGRSYFQGCSTGGRQALISAQRFPRDFDGILAGAPVLDFSGTMLKYTSWVQALAAAPIPAAKLKLLADRVYAQCDTKDGLRDGLIDDPRRCGFQPSQHLPKCDGGDGPDCFTEGQIRSLETIYGDLVIRGQRVYPGWPVGAEIAGPNGRSGWDGWIVRDGAPTTAFLFAETFFRYLAFPKKDPSFQLKQLDFDRDAPRLEWIAQVLNATAPDLSRFRDRGGKLLMWFGWADPALNPLMGVEYYEAVVKKMGPATRDFFRLFMLPGVFHCAGGVGCDSFDRLAALIDWVEQGKAPDGLAASRMEKGKAVRTRPLCPYPQVAKYKGTGNIDDAASFACADPK